MNEQLLQRVRQCPNLPTLPSVAMQVLLFHFLGIAELWMLSGAARQLFHR